MEIKDFIHLYLGCTLDNGNILNAVHVDGSIKTLYRGHLINYWTPEEAKELKLVLRPLSSMTEEEMKELYRLVFNRPFIGGNITHRDIGKKEERKVLWSGVERLFIYRDGDVGADSDLHHFHVHAPKVVRWQLSKHFDLFGLIDAGLAIGTTIILPTDKEVNTKAPGG
jgi:hypothetical protein